MTIDFRHIVQEDAATILSYASPYNVQLELLEGKGTLPSTLTTQSPSPSSLTHPLYRSSSQEDINTIERNARRKLFANDDNSYPTLKMDQRQQQSQKSRSPQHHLPVAHEEHEKKNSLKKFQHFIDMVEEKFQTKLTHSHSNDSNAAALGRQQSQESATSTSKQPVEQRNSVGDDKKGAKFGIRVLPPIVADKMSGKSPNKVQADNENNINLEKTTEEEEKFVGPPEVSKRMKKTEESRKVHTEEVRAEFNRQGSMTSSGIRRDAAGIPQEMPSEMMQAAMAARDNRKPNVVGDKVKSKGKAPRPPTSLEADSLDGSIDTIGTNLSLDVTDAHLSKSTLHKVHAMDKLNFSDNFADEVLNNKSDDSILEYEHLEKNGKRGSNSSTPRSDRKKHASDTESQMAQDHGNVH